MSFEFSGKWVEVGHLHGKGHMAHPHGGWDWILQKIKELAMVDETFIPVSEALENQSNKVRKMNRGTGSLYFRHYKGAESLVVMVFPAT